MVLWAINADNRSTTFDVSALHKLIGDLPEAEQSVLMSRLTFVLTKADILTLPPWILASMGKYGIFAPDEKIKHILWEKELYYQQCFVQPYSRLIVSQTYNDVNFNISHPAFTSNQYTIYYKGTLSTAQTAELKKHYPQYAEIFDRLCDNYRVIACSALFKYNLHQLMLVILNKLGKDAQQRVVETGVIRSLYSIRGTEVDDYAPGEILELDEMSVTVPASVTKQAMGVALDESAENITVVERDRSRLKRTASVRQFFTAAGFDCGKMASDAYKLSQKAMERHKAQNARIIPIILKPTHWKTALFAKLQVLPSDDKPVYSWDHPEEAFLNVVEGIRKVIEELSGQ